MSATPSDTDLTPPELAFEEDILAHFYSDVELLGLAGEERAAKLEYLIVTSRLLPGEKPTARPVSGISKGTSSSGKSFKTRTTLRFFPPEAYLNLGSMSKRYLLYYDGDLSHRVIAIPEWALIANDEELVALVRTLLSEGHVSHGTVDADGKKKREARRIDKSGPVGLLIATTDASVDPELETRCISYLTDDSPEQTRRVFESLARLEDESESADFFERWHALQRWLAKNKPLKSVIPFVGTLAKLMPVSATRLRRDFVTLLCLIRAHAILHCATRARDDRGRIVATIDDYVAVRELVGDFLAEGVEATVAPAIRETVEAVGELLAKNESEYVTVKQVIDRLGIGRSATYDRVKRSLKAGYLVNLAERGFKLALGSPLPGEAEFLPLPDAVRSMSDVLSDTSHGSTIRISEKLSDDPGRPGDPWTEAADPALHEPESDVHAPRDAFPDPFANPPAHARKDESSTAGDGGTIYRLGEAGFEGFVRRRFVEGHLTEAERDELVAQHRALRGRAA